MASGGDNIDQTPSLESVDSLNSLSTMGSITSVDSLAYTNSEDWNSVMAEYENLGDQTIILRFEGLKKKPINVHVRRLVKFSSALEHYADIVNVNPDDIKLTVRGKYCINCEDDSPLSCGLSTHDIVTVSWKQKEVASKSCKSIERRSAK